MLKLNKKAQSVVEYTVLITVIFGAFLAAGVYFKRGMQGRWKAAVDDLGDQYDPRFANTSVRHVLLSNTQTSIISVNAAGGFHTTRQDLSNSLDTRTGFMAVGPF